jgi:hypothetical protein
MLDTILGKKCIIVQFLGMEKSKEKALNAETQSKSRGKNTTRDSSPATAGSE